MNYDVVIFDLDGTLTESEPGIVNSVQYSLDAMGRTDYTPELLRRFIGPPLYESYKNYFGMTDQQAAEGVRIYRERFSEVGWRENSVYAGIPRLLRSLKRQGVYLAMATAKPQLFTQRILEHFGLAGYFDRVCAISLSDHHADKEALIREALPERFGRAVMVGDRKYDLEGARAAGVDGVGVLYGYGSREELAACAPCYLAESVEALTQFLLAGAPVAPGRFISFEGSDGSGKSTQLKEAALWLAQMGEVVTTTREPGGCPISERIREVILDVNNQGMTGVCEALLYAAARAQHVFEVIRPALERGEVVLCDRYLDSNVAYQGCGRGLGEALIRQINAPAVAGCLPDATLLFEMDPAQAMGRRRAANAPDRLEMEQLDFVRRVYEGFEEMARREPERFLRLDANGTREEVAGRVRALVMRALAQ